jgi:hypothetical protein
MSPMRASQRRFTKEEVAEQRSNRWRSRPTRDAKLSSMIKVAEGELYLTPTEEAFRGSSSLACLVLTIADRSRSRAVNACPLAHEKALVCPPARAGVSAPAKRQTMAATPNMRDTRSPVSGSFGSSMSSV